MDYVGTGEIEKSYGLTRVQVHRLIEAGDWPAAAVELDGGTRAWDAREIEKRITRLLDVGRIVRVGGKESKRIRIVPWVYLDEGNMAKRYQLKRNIGAATK
jgi:predicted DNA-binding transcriptional regulator AlpA